MGTVDISLFPQSPILIRIGGQPVSIRLSASAQDINSATSSRSATQQSLIIQFFTLRITYSFVYYPPAVFSLMTLRVMSKSFQNFVSFSFIPKSRRG